MKKLNYIEYCKLQKEIEKISRKKNADYGSDSLVSFGNFGLLIRMSDKIDRLKTLSIKDTRMVKDEKIEDTVMDLINYAMYFILQSRNKLIEEEENENKRL